ncbi:MAG: phosphatase PAP2 family protein [Gemmatimonadota bacterium]|nr:MAG: phosphatase PAP2 family protein [Gemmatimonadota bacterium]
MMRRWTHSLIALSEWVAPAGRFRRRRLLAVLATAYVIFVATYLAVNIYSIGRTSRALWLPGEAALPFIPEFEFFYILGYLVPLLAVFRLPGASEFRRLLVAFGLTLLVAYATYLVFPVYLERPEFEVNSVATFLLSLEYHDPSYNHFPSLHLGTAWLIYLACRRGVRRRVAVVALLLAISLSTVFVKQHYLVDVVFGVGLALAAWWVSGLVEARVADRSAASGGSPAAVK